VIPLMSVAVLAIAAWVLNRFWRAPCILCGHSERACQECAREAGRRMGLGKREGVIDGREDCL
jgi:hypothetical protein